MTCFPVEKRLITFCASLVQNVFAVHRFAQGAADWRSGPRWSIISVLCPVHPFATTWHFPSRGNERYGEKNRASYTSRTISAFSPLVVNAVSQSPECVSCHMTQTANPVTLLASPLGEEGHEVAKGVQANWIHRGAPRPANPVRRHPAKSVWTRGRMIMILDVDVTAERRHYNTHRPKGATTTL